MGSLFDKLNLNLPIKDKRNESSIKLFRARPLLLSRVTGDEM